MTTPTTPSDQANIEWVRSFESGRKWLMRLGVRKSGSDSTRNYYCRALREFCGFIGKDPDVVIVEYRDDTGKDLEGAMEKWGDLLDSFAAHLVRRMKKSSAAVFHAAVKSFFKYNSKIELKAPTPEYYSERVPPVSLDELKELDGLADVQQKFFLRFLKDAGISRSDAVRLNYGNVRKEFEEGEQVIHIEMLRGKEGVEYDTFIGRNAIEALKAYLKLRETRGERITDESPLFYAEKAPYRRLSPAGLSAVFERLGKKAGIKVTPHRVRKFFETYLALAKVHPVILKYWMGHKVARGKKDVEARYIIPPVTEQRSLYAEAYPKIDITGVSLEERLRTIEKVQEKLPEELKREMARLGIRVAKLKVGKPESEANGGDCQRIVGEGELEGYLERGWRMVGQLRSGKVVVESPR